jgi:hypothetical protein
MILTNPFVLYRQYTPSRIAFQMNFRIFTENNSVFLMDGGFYENRFSCQGLTSHTPLRFPFLRSSRPRSLAEAEGGPGDIGPVKLHAVVPRFLEAIARWENNGD